MSIALPSAQRELGISDGDRQWVVTAYALAFGGLLLVGGRSADRMGRKPTFLAGNDRIHALRREGATGMAEYETGNEGWDIVSGVGITALGVAATRAMETTRRDALINDPYAAAFVTRARTRVAMPTSWAAIHDSGERDPANRRWVRAWVAMTDRIGVRSRFFDDYFLGAAAGGVRQVVILAAGLDTRAFRLSWPPGVELFEIDQPKVLGFKDAVLAEHDARPGCTRHVVPADLRADWTTALLGAGFDSRRATVWLAEGLLPYLPGPAAEALFAHVLLLCAPGSWFAADIADPDQRDAMIHHPDFREVQQRLGIDMATLVPDYERPDPARWFHDHHWQLETSTIIQAANRYGRTFTPTAPSGHPFDATTLLSAQRGRRILAS